MEDRLRTDAPRAGWGPLAALGVILLVTAGWWVLALWPVASHPAWLVRTREVCFGSDLRGLPSVGGWLLLIGEPIGMLGILFAVWGTEVGLALRRVASRWPGRLVLAGLLGLAAFGLVRVTALVRSAGPAAAFATSNPAGEAPVDQLAPPLVLVSQWGDTVRLATFLGRPVLVTFAFAHCQTLCPTQVHEVLSARRRAAASRSALAPAVLIVTVDPWRDTPSRLPAIAEGWALGADEYVLSGAIPAVAATLADWRVATRRDTLAGNVDHPSTVFVVGPSGRIVAIGPPIAAELTKALIRM